MYFYVTTCMEVFKTSNLITEVTWLSSIRMDAIVQKDFWKQKLNLPL